MNLRLASLLLPPAKARAIRALYAFLGVADNLVDADAGAGRREALDDWRCRSRRPADMQDDPILRAWAETRDRYGVSQVLAEELMDGVAMDLTVRRYRSFADLQGYCYRVASTVGLMSLRIFGCVDGGASRAEACAARLGLAMQLTNILRDIGEDARMGRIYLPLEEMAAVGYTEGDLLAGRITPAFRWLLRGQIARAHALYDASLPGIALLQRDSRAAVAIAAAGYRAILPAIVANGYDVFGRRARSTLRDTLALLPRAWRVTPDSEV